MKGIAMKTASVVALAMFCFTIGPAAVHGENIVTVPILTFTGHTDIVFSVTFSPDGTKVLTGSNDKTARLWDAASGAEIRTFIGHTSSVESVAFSPDGTRVLSGSVDGSARLWDAATGVQIRTFTGHTDYVRSVAFSPDGTKVLTGAGYADSTARLWDAATGAHIRTFSGHTDSVPSVAFSPDGAQVLTCGGWDKTARLWNAWTAEQIRTFTGHTGWVGSVAFSPDGTKVLTGGDNTARLWDAGTGAQIRTFSGHTDRVWSVAFSPDGSQVLTGSWDNTAKLWDAATGACIRTFTGHTHRVWSVAFSPDGTKVLTGNEHKTAMLWDARPELLVRSSPIMGVSISGDAPGVTDFNKIFSQASQTVTLTAPPVALNGAVRYDFIRWEIDGQEQPTGQLSVKFTVDRSMTATAVYEIRKHALSVNSEPVTGITIGGNPTNHTLTVNDQQVVELSAPAVASVGGLDYGFIRWVIDGQEQPPGQSIVSLTMDADRTVVAVYFRARLSVTSAPYSGIYIPGSHGDMTPYERVFLAPQDVSLYAQLRLFRASVPYNFAYWKINGSPQQPRQTDIQFRVEADAAVEAVYNILGDANGDCVVNVLDLIFIRNRLGGKSDDSWRGDVNLDGSVDVLDLISTRNKLGARCQ